MRVDQESFLSDRFDVNAYANAVLAGKVYKPDEEDAGISQASTGEKGDVGVELAKLNLGIEDVTKQLRQEITTSYPLLLNHLTTSISLSSHLSPIRSSLDSLASSLDRLHAKIHDPYEHLSLLVRRINLLAQASDLTRRAARFVLLARRLEGQMIKVKAAGTQDQVNGVSNGVSSNDAKTFGAGEKGRENSGEGEKDRELAKAALSVAELDALLQPPSAGDAAEVNPAQSTLPLQSLDFVKAYIPTVDKARDSIIQEMESMVVSGLADLNQPLLSSSLQTAHNLRLLPDLVSNLLADLNDAVTARIQRAFDSAAIGREVSGKDTASQSAIKFTSRARPPTEPSSSNKEQWIKVLWTRLGRVIEDVANACIKVYTLEKVLKMKRDPVVDLDFLEIVMKSLDEKPSFTFWTTLAQAFETQTKEAARSSAWMQQALSSGYPRLLRLFHDFFAKIAVHTDTIYTRDYQSTEAVLVLRSVSVFETLYLSRSTNRMTEIANASMASYVSGRGTPPGAAEGVGVARVMTNELDSARFDPLLGRTVARNAAKVLDTLLTRVDGALVKDFTATSLIGPQATPAQIVNAQLTSFLYHCRFNLLFVEQEFPAKVWEILLPTINTFEAVYTRIKDALDTVIKREMASILSRLHRVDFAKPMDPMAMGGSGSPYMQDLIDKLAFIKSELLSRMSLGDLMRQWTLDLSGFLLRTFLIHASIARPLGESGKLKLTSDMTELEMGISSLLSTGQVQGQKNRATKIEQVGDDYLALRSFRTLLFAEASSMTNPVETIHIPPMIVLHHIIVQSPLLLPHQVHKWSEAEYVLWLQKHEDQPARLDLLEKSLKDQKGEGLSNGHKESKQQGTATSKEVAPANGEKHAEEEKYLTLIRQVLATAREDQDEPSPPP